MARQQRTQRQTITRGPLGAILGVGALVLVLYLLFNILSIGWSILGFAAPILFIASLIFNKNVAIDYGKMLVNTFKTDALKGVIYSGLTFIGHPLVALYLFVRAYMTSKVKDKVNKKRAKAKDEKAYTDYEDVEDDDDFLELPDLDAEPPKQKLKDTGYENLFE